MKISQVLWFFVCLTFIALAVIGGGQQPDYSKTVTLTPVAPNDQFTPTLAPQEMAIYNVTINRTGTKDGIAYELDEDLDPNPSVTKNPAADPNLLWVWNDQAGGGGNNPNYEFKIVNTIWDEKTVTVTVKCTWVPVPVPGDGNGGEGEVPDPIHGKAEGIALHQWGALVPTSDIAVDGAPDYLCINEMITLSSWLVLDEFEYEDPELIESYWRVEGLAPSYGGGTIEPNPDHTVVFTPTNTGLVRVTATESLYNTNSGTVEFTIVKVEIETEDEPGSLICVGNTKEYTAVVTPTNVANAGEFAWSVSDANKLGIVGATNNSSVIVTGKLASASMNDEELTVQFRINNELICAPSTNLTVVDFTTIKLATTNGTRYVEDITQADEPPSVTNTLFLCEGTNGIAAMTIEGWWEPTGVTNTHMRWEIVLTNETANPPEWDITSSTFATNPVTVTWDVADAVGGITNRQFIVRGWYDCDESGDYDSDFPHRELFVTIIRVDITEAKGLYKEDGSYEDGYTSSNDLGRIYCNRIYNSTNLSETIWTADTQYVDFTVTLTPTNVTLPAGARIVWEWEDPDDPSDSGMNTNAAAEIDANDYDSADSDGDGNDQDGSDNTGTNDAGAVWEEIDSAYALSGTNETAISNGISKVRFNVTDDGGDNFIVKAKLKLDAGATPCDGDETGVMTVWKKIGMEYVKMTNGLALPVDDLPGEFEVCFVDFTVDPVRGVADNYVFTNGFWYMGTNSATAYGKCLDYVTAASGEFSKEGPGWFFIASANRFAPVGSGSSEVLYPASGTASNATALVNKITLPTAIPSNKTPDIVYIYDSTLASNVLFVVKDGTLSADRKTFEIEKKDYYPVDDPYTSFLDADLTDYGFASNSTIQVRVLSPGAYGVGGISPGLAGKTIIFTRWSGADCLDTMVHEMTHAFGLAHKCGNWDHTTTTPSESCPMNYGSWFILDDASPRAPIQWTNKRAETSLCAPHIKAVRQSNLEDLMGW